MVSLASYNISAIVALVLALYGFCGAWILATAVRALQRETKSIWKSLAIPIITSIIFIFVAASPIRIATLGVLLGIAIMGFLCALGGIIWSDV